MKEYVLSAGAELDLDEIWEYIAHDNINAADSGCAGHSIIPASAHPVKSTIMPDSPSVFIQIHHCHGRAARYRLSCDGNHGLRDSYRYSLQG